MKTPDQDGLHSRRLFLKGERQQPGIEYFTKKKLATNIVLLRELVEKFEPGGPPSTSWSIYKSHLLSFAALNTGQLISTLQSPETSRWSVSKKSALLQVAKERLIKINAL